MSKKESKHITSCTISWENTEDILSYVLSADSPLIGAGIEIEGAPETDFFGNKIT